MIQIEVDTQGQMVAIGQRLEQLAFEAPNVLRLSLNAAARQVRKQLNEEADYPVAEGVVRYDKPFVLLNTPDGEKRRRPPRRGGGLPGRARRGRLGDHHPAG